MWPTLRPPVGIESKQSLTAGGACPRVWWDARNDCYSIGWTGNDPRVLHCPYRRSRFSCRYATISSTLLVPSVSTVPSSSGVA